MQVPGHVPAECVVDFDIYDPPVDNDDSDGGSAWRKILKSGNPELLWSPYNGGHWIATHAEDIKLIFSDATQFSSEHILIPRGEYPLPTLPQESDPPEHTAYRAIINPWFSPRRVESLEQRAQQLAVELIEDIAPRGRCEFIEEFANPYPTAIVMALVDLPLADRPYLQRLSNDQVRHPELDRRRAAFDELSAYLSAVIEERRQAPGDDLISAIVHARFGDRPLSPDEILGMLSSLIGGGLDTVSASLGHITHFLAESSPHRHALAADPDLVVKASEELLRRFGVAAPARTVAHDMEFKGIPLKQGDMIQVPTFLHNWDPARYQEPLSVDFGRKDTVHGTFGFGVHRCAGAALARMEIRIFLREWLARIPNFQVPPDATIRFEGGLTLAVAQLPLQWQTA